MIDFENDVLKSDKPVFVRFGIDTGCGYCDTYSPLFDAFAEKHDEYRCFTISKPNTGSPQPALAIEYDVESYPTTILFVGGEIVNQRTGAMNAKQLLNMLKTFRNISEEELQNELFVCRE